jgi:glucokinase
MTTAPETQVYSLIGDVGGTNTRLQLISFGSTCTKPVEVKTHFYRTREKASLSECILDFLQEFLGTEKYPKNATLAVAGAPYEGKVTLPNAEWPTLDEQELEKEFKISPFALINDFVAIGYSMAKIPADQMITLHEGKKASNSTMIVTGPGTGMGECIIQPSANLDGKPSYTVFGTEGGHKNFSPTAMLEWEYLNFVLDEFPDIKEKFGYLSTEKAFCGPGIPNIYKFFCRKDDIQDREITSEEIIQRALAKEDPQCVKVLEFFATLYAKEVSNFALNSLPYGGIYLVGGLTNAVGEYLKNESSSPFKAGYFSKGKVINNLLERFPIYIVKEKELGLLGAFVKAQKDAFCL